MQGVVCTCGRTVPRAEVQIWVQSSAYSPPISSLVPSHQHFSVSAAWVPPLLHTYGMFFKFRTSIHLSAFRVHYSRWFSTFLDLLRSGNWADNWTEIWLIKRKIWIHFDVSKHLSVLSPQTFVFQCAYTKNCEWFLPSVTVAVSSIYRTFFVAPTRHSALHSPTTFF